MDIDPMDVVENAKDTPTARKSAWLNPAVAITVALLATFMGICKVKDDNIVQAMQQAQADKLDHWQFYQARNIREEIAKSTLTQLRLQAQGAPANATAAYQEQIAAYTSLAEDQKAKKEEVRGQAEKDQANYDALNFRDDQFDLSDTLMAIAISMLAVTALTGKRWLYWIALVPTGLGILMGVAFQPAWPAAALRW